jgi:hypothetical protein
MKRLNRSLSFGRNSYFTTWKKIGLVSSIPLFTLGLSLTTASRLAAQNDRQCVIASHTKVIATSTHIYSATMTVPVGGAPTDPPRMTETICAGAAAYTRTAGGRRTGGRTSLQQVLKLEEQNLRDSTHRRHYLRDEAVNGEAAAVYSIHSENADQKSDGQVWISKTNGLILRKEFDIDLSDMGPHGEAQRDHYSVRCEHTNVRPPV